MRISIPVSAALILALGLSLAGAASVRAQNEIHIPALVYRTGPYAPSGVPIANGVRDYLALLNARDGGIDGVKIAAPECEFQYDTKQGVECYEKYKGSGATRAVIMMPYSTGLTYQIIPKAAVDQIPVLTMGYGQTIAADGHVFEWVFNPPDTYPSQASAVVRYIGQQEGGLDKLKGKRLALVHLNAPSGKEAIPTLRTLAQRYGYELRTLAVDSPGQEQGATWLQVRQYRPDWILVWCFGVMNQVAVKEAAAINYPMDHLIGWWWSGSEADVVPAGAAAAGYRSTTFHAPGSNYPLHKDIVRIVYKGDAAKAKENTLGEVMYNRGLVNAIYATEGIRTAMKHYGGKSVTGAQVRWGMENLDLTTQRLKELGVDGMVSPLKLTCADHEMGGALRIQAWDGKEWNFASDWLAPMHDVVRPMLEQEAAAYAKENNITPRTCS